MTRMHVALLAALAGALVTGCVAGPDFQRPDTTASQRYTREPIPATLGGEDIETQRLVPDAALDAQWWRMFASAPLDGLVDRALAGNRTLASATAALEQAQQLLSARTGERLPEIDLTAGLGRQKYGAQFLGPLPRPPPFTYYAVGPTVSYTLDLGGGVKRSIEQQRALADVQQQQLVAARLAVSGNAVMQALTIASLRAQIVTVEDLLERDRRNVQLVQQALEAGSVSRLDVLSAQSQLASDQTLLPPLRQSLDVARHALALILGESPADAVLPDLDLAQVTLPAELPLNVPSELAHRRPDILAAEARLHAATAAIGIAQSNLYPHITLSATTSQQSIESAALFDSASNAWGLTSGLVQPLFRGGALRAEKRASVAAMQARAASYQQTVLEAFGQVADSLQALDHGAAQLAAQARAESAARETADLTRESFNEGATSVLQVLDAERRYQQARLGFVRAQAQRYIDSAQLMLAIGPG